MIVAYKILNTILREDFNFQHIMWIFSGRRGIHCWVSDERARTLTNEGRSSISNYIKIKTMNSKTGVGSTLKNPIHPTHLKSLEIIESNFDEVALNNQEILLDERIQELVEVYIKAYFMYKKNVQGKDNSYTYLFINRWN